MPNSKEENAKMLDPQRFQIAKSMAVIPGGPQNNNPMNVTDNASPPIRSESIMGDYAQNYTQMGTSAVFPMSPSGNLQNAVVGVGLNSGAQYGYQQQPPSQAADELESSRTGMDAKNRGLFPSPMGPLGQSATPAPGGVVPSPQQSEGTMPLQGVPNAEAMTGGMNMKSGKRS